MDSSNEGRDRPSKTGSYMSIGASIGILFGLLLFDGNPALGLVTGMLLGLSLGAVHDQLGRTPRNSFFGAGVGAGAGMVVGILLGQIQPGFLVVIGASFGLAFGMIEDTPEQTLTLPLVGAIAGSILGAGLGILAGWLHGWHASVTGYSHTYLLSLPFIDDYIFAGSGVIAAMGIWYGMHHNRKR